MVFWASHQQRLHGVTSDSNAGISSTIVDCAGAGDETAVQCRSCCCARRCKLACRAHWGTKIRHMACSKGTPLSTVLALAVA